MFWGNLARGALQFGFEMGTGVRTFTTASAPLIIGLAILFGVVGGWTAAFVGAAFGMARGVVPLSRWLSSAHGPWQRNLDRAADAGTYQRVAGPASLVAASVALVTL